MANINNLKGIVTKELHVFYLIDNSGSMKGQPIATVNYAMRETIEELKNIIAPNDIHLKIAAMEFNTNVKWITQGERHLENVDDFIWEDVEADGRTSLGAALSLLNRSMTQDKMMHSKTGNKAPVIIVMSDGAPTDEWIESLEKLQKNEWFKQAIKIGIAIGSRADVNVLSRLVGSKEAVIFADNLDYLRKIIRIVSVTSSLSGSYSHTSKTNVTGASIVQNIKSEETEMFKDFKVQDFNFDEVPLSDEETKDLFDMDNYDMMDFDELFKEGF